MAAQEAYGRVFPFEGDDEAGQPEWRIMDRAHGDGVINALDLVPFSIASKSGSDRTFVLNLGQARIQGVVFDPIDDTVTITVPAPGGGLKRADRLKLVMDPGDKSINVVLDHTGTETAGTPVPPATTRDPDDVWEMPLWEISGGTGVATGLAFTDLRRWAGQDPMLVASSASLDPTATLGSTAVAANTGHRFTRRMVGSTATWVDSDALNWRAIGLPVSREVFGQAPQVGVLRGVVYLRGAYQQKSPLGGLFGSGIVYSLGSLVAGELPGQDCNFPADHQFGATAYNLRIAITAGGVITGTPHGDTTIMRLDGINFPQEG